MQAETLAMIAAGTAGKGDVLAVARLAGIMAAKRTADLIPLCHPLPLSAVAVDLAVDPEGPAVEITAACRVEHRTGVEMEALTAAAIAALTVYDMCKSADRGMRIEALRLAGEDGAPPVPSRRHKPRNARKCGSLRSADPPLLHVGRTRVFRRGDEAPPLLPTRPPAVQPVDDDQVQRQLAMV
ncbi:MAG: cyclic pyranopterin monophosphate synthase MoaC [Rhodospirillales bacterium]